MALDNSYRRGETSDAKQNGGDDVDEFIWTRLPAVGPTGCANSVTLWDEVAPTVPLDLPLEDDSPEG